MMRNGIVFIGSAFAIALAVVVGNRLSNDSLAVLVGAVCGLSASIPVVIGLVIATTNHWGRRNDAPPRQVEYDYASHRYAPQPPVYIVAPPQAQMPASYMFPQNQFMTPNDAPMLGAPRDFKIVGDE